MEEYTCRHCSTKNNVALKKDIEGFPHFKCSNCKKRNYFPLSKVYRNLYIVILTLFVLGFLFVIPLDYVLLPGLLVIAALEALIRDQRLRNR